MIAWLLMLLGAALFLWAFAHGYPALFIAGISLLTAGFFWREHGRRAK